MLAYKPRFSWCHGTIDEKQIPIVLCTINPLKPRDIVVRYLTTNEQIDIVAELEKDCGHKLPTIHNAAVNLAVAAEQYTKKVNIPWNTNNLPRYSAKKNQNASLRGDPATTLLNSKWELQTLLTVKSTP
jgi:hypothetical protein